jgi:type II secretory pathway pseudopilin PulG
MKLPKMKKLRKPNSSGDTIVEVMIALAIAAFAIGISYATASRSLDQAISAREHNEALNIMENQLTDLRLRYQKTPASTFESTYGNANTNHHYCLNDDSTGPNDTVHQWTPIFNNNITVNSLGPPNYNSLCNIQRTTQGALEGAIYWLDISTSPSGAQNSPTLFHVSVRWARLGGGISQANLFYKLDGSTAGVLAAATQNTNILPSCPLPSPNPISETDPVLKLLSSAPTYQSWTYKYTDQPYTNLGNASPWKPNPACTYTISITTRIRAPIPSPPQNNEQLFIQFCNSPTSCEYTSPLTPDINEPTSSTAITNPVFSHVFSGNDINYLKIEHCSIYPGGPSGCSTSLNRIDAYDITVTGS